MTSSIVKRALELYGGEKLWSEAKYIEAEVSAKGWAFILKRRPSFNHAKLFMEVHKPFCKITPIGKHGISGVLDGNDIRLEDSQGHVIAQRNNARDYFTFGRRLFYWDDMDMAYFANYAFWNYFTFPALLMNKEIVWEVKSPETIQATFPDIIPTHSKIQSFHFNAESGLLFQHDYTADIISKYAKAANVILKHDSEKDGLLFPSHRRVTPRTPKGLPLLWPVLIEIEVHDFKLINISSHHSNT
ncbi:MAG: hypothetical protein R2880_04395 [Deinococcales bacterium]